MYTSRKKRISSKFLIYLVEYLRSLRRTILQGTNRSVIHLIATSFSDLHIQDCVSGKLALGDDRLGVGSLILTSHITPSHYV